MNKLMTAVLFGCAAIACGSSVKYVDFKVPEGNREVTVRKFYNDGLDSANSQDPTERAYQAVAHGNIEEGIKLGKEAVAADPKNVWTHYDLGILYEAHREWGPAREQMVEAQKIDPQNSDVRKEIAFIDAHK